MPIKQAAKKALRQSIKKAARNLDVKKKVEFLQRQIGKALNSKTVEEAEKLFSQLQKSVDKAAREHVFHVNKTNRIKARLVKKINQLKKK